MHEVLAYGVIAPSTLIELSNGYPPVAGYAEVNAVHPSIGGEAAAGAHVLARLGVRTKLTGTRLGTDPASRGVIEALADAGVDCSGVATDAEQPVTEFVVSGSGDRTIFASYGRMLADRSWARPSRPDIEASRMVCLDPFFGPDSDQAAEWCRETSTPYVTIDAPAESPVVAHATAVVISEEYASRTHGPVDPHDLVTAYSHACGGLVILTQGDSPIVYGRNDQPLREVTPFSVEPRDTTGAGDAFRAGVIFGLVRGYDDARTVTVAAAVAAMVCERVPGVLGSPTQDELQSFMETHRRAAGEPRADA